MVQVVAHRGSSIDHAEHTLAAYKQAITDGADALECDVRLTRDGHLICVHDRRVDRTSDGRGVVSTLELADLRELDFGSRHRDRTDREAKGDWEEPDRDSTGVLTLDRLLEYVVDAGRRVELAIETKHPTRYAGLVERHLIDVLDRFGLARPASGDELPPVRIMSFAATGLRRVHILAPALPTVLLFRRMPLRYRDGSLPPRIMASGPDIGIVRAHPGYVARVHEHGHQVHVWTVDDTADVDLLVGLGVDVIITNRPREVLSQLGRTPPTNDPAGALSSG